MDDKVLEKIMQDIRDLRDADSHVCEYDAIGDDGYCSCQDYDSVIDAIQTLIDS